MAEGEKVVRRLLESRLCVRSVLMPPKWLPEFEGLLQARSEEIRVFLAEKKLLETLTGFSMYQGLLAVAQVPANRTLLEILQPIPRPWLLAATDKLSSAENMGALVRNCAAFDASALLVSENCCSPFLRRAVRNSMGAIFHLPIRECTSLVQELQTLKSMGVRCIAAHPHVDWAHPARSDLFRAMFVSFLAAKVMGFPPPFWSSAMMRWQYPCPRPSIP